MDKDECIEKLKAIGYKVEESQKGIIYCYECDDAAAFREAVKSIGYNRSFGSTPHKKDELKY